LYASSKTCIFIYRPIVLHERAQKANKVTQKKQLCLCKRQKTERTYHAKETGAINGYASTQLYSKLENATGCIIYRKAE
jgi:hypothetical protein